MASVSNTGIQDEPSVQAGASVDVQDSGADSKWYRWRKDGTALAKYLLDSEVHTFAFSVAANAILSFIPFIVLLDTLARTVFHSPTMAAVVSDIATNFLPSTAREDFWARNLRAMVPHRVQFFSVVMILVSCTGIFLPLEVALNQAWGVTKSRNYLLNQAVAFGLAILMVVLGMGTVMLNATARDLLTAFFFQNANPFWEAVYHWIAFSLLAATAGIASISFFFCIYWLLPNRKVPASSVLRPAVVTGLVWLGAKYLFVVLLPHMDLVSLYGPFSISVDLLFWSYASGLILFAGAQFSVSRMAAKS